ncbi:hypothetical protein QRX50_46320 [Amycolatopsis carbonis]|uniref:DNA primase/polymerase bifunctional N-terminal domain-containing protein n=1 Tax=Amycolatopsis carbonis TaxID=715471 RepID=A0A9Y2IHH1_9PSEU|nr:hypothetical protein [Amycolatopsis sp. 2-15]WIX78678.1 hypothetical protein QRX50_46320 [Amycolatopsis sp. 2-15]
MSSQPNPGRPLWAVNAEGRPRVRVGEDPEAIRVLTDAVNRRIIPETYVSDGAPVVVEEISGAADPATAEDDVALPIVASVLKPPLLAGLLAEHAEVFRPKKVGENWVDTEVTPPGPVLGAVLARQSWPGLPVLRRIISTPVLRPDGTLLQEPGYDPATGFYLAGNHHLAPIPDHPTPQEVAQAREFLFERFLRDFPWRTDADRANYLALLVTPLIRPFTRALSPFGMIEASMPGSGKTILAGCVGLLVGQRVLTWTDSEDELRKSITTVLSDAVGVIVFDNLAEGAVVDSAVLARLVTERTWSDRKLGTNAAATFPNDRLWLATGNNLRTGGDMASRSVWVRLDPNCPRPETRTGFTIPNLDTWILDPANRATVLRHVLILILDWTAHGASPATAVPQMRQFTPWARHLGGFLEHHGVRGFLTNADATRDLDDEDAEWRSFFLTWEELHGDRHMTAQDLRISGEPTAGTDPWAGTFPVTPSGKPLTTKSLGRKLAGQVDRWHTDVVLRSEVDSHRNCKTYWVVRNDS